METLLINGIEKQFLTIKSAISLYGEPLISCVSIDQTHAVREQRELEDDLRRQKTLMSTRDQLLVVLGHDIRTPISGLVSYCEYLALNFAEDQSGEQGDNIFQEIGTNSQNILAMVDNLLLWVQSQQDKLEAKREAVAVGELITRTVSVYQHLIQKKEIELEIHLAPALKDACTDRDILAVILRNLVSNAVKYTPLRGKLTIEANFINDENIAISVTDSGEGISEEVLERMEAHSNSTRETFGTNSESGFGLGLEFSTELAHRIGAELTFENKKPGTKATICLPIQHQERLTQLIYRSEEVEPFTLANLADLERKAAGANKRKQVSGILLYRRGVFVQLLEGRKEAVDQVYRKILHDPRHDNIMVLEYETITERSYPDWSMRLFQGDSRIDFLDVVKSGESQKKGVSFEMLETLFTKASNQGNWLRSKWLDCWS